MSGYIIETGGLTRRFGERVSVDQLNLRVPEGKIYGFLGANGAGKTTTIRMLLSLIRPDEGTIQIMGRSLSHHREAILRNIGSLVEAPSYYGHLSAYQNLKLIAKLLDLPESNIREALDTVRLTPYAKQTVKGYSLGMKQRLGIAQALIRKPRILILDEPINGLDPAGIQEIRHLLLSLSREQGITIFLSSHILSEIQAVSDYVGIIQNGKLIFQDRIQELEKRNKVRLAIIADRTDEAYRVLAGGGAEIERYGSQLLITVTERMSQADIFKLLQPFTLHQVKEVTASLEEIFLQLTGRGESL
ncbi:MAG: ATP-binding cassette domain-containing protein [Paenibacillus macerans]|uniref:ABC transporter family protein n=1 Tax=Paenibacillus macerans TaxID=44252 RepID=A0A090ZFY9_PAEMA|nr:ATP-binding cassette domain-containing protein [Paenibacillus macerans]KFN10244.1 ABC transporter family protein [Paenibacillus macerans]MBS5914525.1 ATP-binding cassette domain-containing protein [Paenibacillus macerans]MDU5947551.1 ATP-binding cassette domain-containing protein [Paenibacillus macerans]MDU7476301.1 ATP-binding cassette domain-containing protein [Paenibacillus macerans]MEC0140861.1 ATP-binding cassette domain-containing protein [Paenibacillus macerans]